MYVSPHPENRLFLVEFVLDCVNWINNRYINVYGNVTSNIPSEVNIMKYDGVLRGSVLGPWMFLFYINNFEIKCYERDISFLFM